LVCARSPTEIVDQDVDVRTCGFADQRGQFRGGALVAPRHAAVEVAVALLAGQPVLAGARALVGKGIELEGGVTGIDDRTDFRDNALRAGELRLVRVRVE